MPLPALCVTVFVCKIMSEILKECFLQPISHNHPPIRINTEQTIVGRSPETLIQDQNCSRKQVCLKANLKDGYVLVKTLGLNSSVLSGKEMQRNVGYEAVEGDTIELLPGLYKYVLKFVYETATPNQLPDEQSSSEMKHNIKAEETQEEKKHKAQKDGSIGNSSGSGSSKRSRDGETAAVESTSKRSKVVLPETIIPVKQEPETKPKLTPKTPTTADTWQAVDGKLLHIYTSAGVMASEKIAAYDMDGTLIKTKSGNVFPKSIDDWQIAFSEVPNKLKTLHRNGFKLVIFTNQAGIGKGKVRIEDFRQKIESLVRKLGVPMQVFISTGPGVYRKPRIGMWQTLCDRQNDGIPIDVARSFYVGDAAGRPEQQKPFKRRKDHSCADRLLALNVGISFQTPEQHFQNKRETDQWTRPEFDPKEVCDAMDKAVNVPLLSPISARLTGDGQEVIVMVGFPGSGKSHFVRQQLAPKGYEIVNRDTLGSWQRCVVHMETCLRQGKSVVIDNLNPDVESRKRYLLVAARMKVPVRCFVMDVGYKHARHNNEFRELTDNTHSTISEMVFNSYKSKYKEPTMVEGFTEIVRVKFVPKFTSKSHEQLYRMYLLEK
uniref:PNK FHA domain-containing protein n=1 Tax=Anopheles farauti TaxID=69004 RepID=A0A182QB07_9DIPT